MNNNNLYEWVTKSRNDDLPVNAIYAGSTSTDGHVYVARFNNIPGKVNLSNNKIYNFWVQAIGSSTIGEVLITTNIYKWIDIKRGDKIPNNAIYSGLDQNGDKVWVGRTINGESGKINCHDNISDTPLMHNLWYNKHNSDTKAHILVIEKDHKINTDETIEEVIVKNNKLEYIHSNQTSVGELPLWSHCIINKLSKTVNSAKLDVSVGQLAKNMFDIFSTIGGDIITLAHLITKFNINLAYNTSSEVVTNREIIITPPNSNGNSKYIILNFSKIEKIKSHKILGCYAYDKTYSDIKVDYMILEPSNTPAKLKCENLINDKADMIINSFRPIRM
jgi:hypothetical protein